jgi:putative endonuclease
MIAHSSTKETGKTGEDVAALFLERRGFVILDRNYWKKWGEIDIIASKGDMVHFVEVKAVSYETKFGLKHAVSQETWLPEEQVHQAKMRNLANTIESWVIEKAYTGEWQIDVISVRLVPRETFATVKIIENV